MSEFFKALEQAERDRAREQEPESVSPAPTPRTTVRENGTRENGIPAEAPAAKPVITKPAVARPAPPVVKAPPVRKATFAKRPATAPSQPPPERMFRPSLRTPGTSWFGGRQPMLVVQSHPSSAEADAYRTLRANIELMSDDRTVRHIAITSTGGGDGKSTTAANLAVVAAQGGRRVCLVDADLSRPTLHDVFGLPNVDGLTSILEQGKPLDTVAKPSDIANLSIVVAGRGPQENFRDLLTAQRLEQILQGSEAVFDLVLFDSPPVMAAADALSVAAVCDGVIFVVRSGSIPFDVLQRAIGQIKQVKGRVLGVLLNQVRAAHAGSYRYQRAYQTGRSKT